MKRLLCVLMVLVMAVLLAPTAIAEDEPSPVMPDPPYQSYYTDCPCCQGSGTVYVGPVSFVNENDEFVGWGKIVSCRCCYFQVFAPDGEQIVDSSCMWDDGVVTKEPTTTETGVKTYTCSECGLTKTEAIAVKEPEQPHVHAEEWVPGTPATCTHTGLTDGVKCKWCGEILVAQEEIPKTDHVYSMWVSNGNGKHYASCLNGCGHQEAADCQMVQLPIKNADGESISLCPVCGACDGAAVTAVKGLKAGEGAPYRGTLRAWSVEADGNNKYLAVSFDRFGKTMQPEGEVSFTLPDELQGTGMGVVDADDNVTPAQESDGNLKLDFSSTEVVVLKNN